MEARSLPDPRGSRPSFLRLAALALAAALLAPTAVAGHETLVETPIGSVGPHVPHVPPVTSVEEHIMRILGHLLSSEQTVLDRVHAIEDSLERLGDDAGDLLKIVLRDLLVCLRDPLPCSAGPS